MGTLVARPSGADPARSLEPVHLGHLDVHQDHIVAAALHRLDGLEPVDGQVGPVSHLPEQVEGQFLVEGVVFRQEDLQGEPSGHLRVGFGRLGSRAGRPLLRSTENAGHHVKQLGLLDGLGEVCRPIDLVGTCLSAAEGREHHQGQAFCVAQFADFLGQVNAVHPRHVHVHNHQIEGVSPSNPGQGLGRRAGLAGDHPPVLGLQDDDAPVGGVVVHDQQAPPGQARLLAAKAGRSLGNRWFGPDGKMEGRALSGDAFHPHGAAHHLGQSLGDGQAQAGAAVFPGRGGIHLAEGPEQDLQAILRDADARVAHGKMQGHGFFLSRLLRPLFHGHREHHLALLGELHRVVEQVDQDLAQSRHVAENGRRDVRPDFHRQVELLFGGAGREQVDGALQTLAQVKGGVFQLHLSGFDLGEVQDVVDDRQEGIPAGADDLHKLLLRLIERGVDQQPAHADNGIHGGADLMAHGGQERALRLRGGFGRCLGFLQFHLRLLAFGDVANRLDGAHDLAP